jgi:hypothetical protein
MASQYCVEACCSTTIAQVGVKYTYRLLASLLSVLCHLRSLLWMRELYYDTSPTVWFVSRLRCCYVTASLYTLAKR